MLIKESREKQKADEEQCKPGRSQGLDMHIGGGVERINEENWEEKRI